MSEQAQNRCHGRGIFHAINPGGTQKWSYDTQTDINGDSDIYTGAFVTSEGPEGTVWVSSEAQIIYGFNGQTGAVRY